MTESKLSMKLLIDTQINRVLFAETNKDCVDFLFHVLTLPISTFTGFLKKTGTVGSLENLYQSIENLDETYTLPNHSKDLLLKPTSVRACPCTIPVLQISNAPPIEKKFYRCGNCSSYSVSRVTDDMRAVCPGCFQKMTTAVTYVAPPAAVASETKETGFVKGVVTYMVMDDLVVTPMSTISCITLLNKFRVKDVSVLEEKVVNLSMDEAVKLLKASLYSKKVLTEVFIPKQEQKTTVSERVEDVNDHDEPLQELCKLGTTLLVRN